MTGLHHLGATQQALLRHMLQQPDGIAVEALCERLRISHNAVRQHLNALMAKGWVERMAPRPTGGRPEARFRLTADAHALFPRNYAQIAGALMQGVIARLGDDGAREMLVALGQQLGTAEPAPDPDLPPDAVADALAQRLDQLGYEAVATQRGGEAQVEAYNCVFHALAPSIRTCAASTSPSWKPRRGTASTIWNASCVAGMCAASASVTMEAGGQARSRSRQGPARGAPCRRLRKRSRSSSSSCQSRASGYGARAVLTSCMALHALGADGSWLASEDVLPPMIELRRPRPDDEDAFLRARAAVPADNPTFLRDYRQEMAYRDFLRLLEDHRAGRGLPRGVAPSSFLFAFGHGGIVGRASIRHTLTPPLGKVAGHIGYAVLPEFRNRGYATQILRASVRFARDELGLDRVLVTCDDDNLASIRVIEKNGGVLADTCRDATLRRPKRRYWIDAAAAGTHRPGDAV